MNPLTRYEPLAGQLDTIFNDFFRPAFVLDNRTGDAGRLRVDVTDDGIGVPPAFAAAAARGLGLRNTAERLRRSYGVAASLEVAPGSAGGTRATVVLPLRYAVRDEASVPG